MRKNVIKYILIIVVVFAVLLAVSSYSLNGKENLTFFEKTIKDTTSYICKIAYTPIKYVKNKVKVLSNAEKWYKKYYDLKEKDDKSELYYSEIEELKKEVEELKKTLDLNATLSEYTYINATVINRNIGTWFNTITIDKGSKNGIKNGDAVITSLGLIGKIDGVANFSSTVKLLTTNEINNKISIKIINESNSYHGLLVGYNSERGVYIIEGITEPDKIKEGNTVTTTGLTDYFPSGIVIGKVSKVVMDEYDLNSIVEVIPTVDFNDFEFVTVLNRSIDR